MSMFVGVDIGGTTCTIAVGNEEGVVLDVSDQFPTRSKDGPEETIADILAQILAVLQRQGCEASDVKHLALATPGPATIDGVLLQSPNLDPSKWDRFPIRQALQEAFQEVSPSASVSYVGDGQAAALGEYAIRTGRIHWPSLSQQDDGDFVDAEDLNSIFMVAVGTGLGGGEVRDGVTVRGREGRAGHAGHLMLPADAFRYEHDRRLKVGNAYNTAESAISLTALTHQLGYRLTLDQWRDHPLNGQQTSDKEKAKQLRELAAEGDPLALQLFDDQAKALGIALLMINYIGDYDLLVIGGGICDITPELQERYLRVAKQAYYAHALDGFRNSANFSFSVCGDQASVIGALVQAYDQGISCC
jgi:predicted NBD/HSP70 family sugar kinase